ncbi:MAG TPA: hypothetical protein VN428_11695 [Bryobacteraceae bacterium]|nr:hypothetical protein [Bryobacteraceae bacterium]
MLAKTMKLASNLALALTALLLVLVLFNPFVPIVSFSGRMSLLLVLGTIVSLAASLPLLRTRPLRSMQSINNRTPGSISL